MATTIRLETQLDCPPDEAWARAQTSALLLHIAMPLIRFVPIGRPFPERWEVGEYRTAMRLFGFLPIGWQAVVISFPPPDGATRFMRDNGYGPLIRQWDHWIEIAPGAQADQTLYVDRVSIDAGLLTPLVAGFARLFYAHRQRRWRALVRARFASLRA